ncbi:flagellar basal body P-ring formation chaperone FlgA [Aureimonas phyllosphaerae]|uniref:Flagella basal body P-ring formation protein FlgA n=1 Tax=Aureimonas phyllosphaerae TaxID=1166078 RepID=A0A7W6BPB0_9HYPH|nr:flagellar basal body P-ring formation chaperone FlgA [Aureimonas phyllosphaerae]MBB3935573.1 flagella basal body P-ring formation protein FlgA [Aureimonas phyllosphaerae]MBB3959581.1 flagella basal body P-ring formation protein FlgA [Aureimonas phyllosphaerae]SFF12444.1 flagella basal body P-ring formation protein FlgA [Aureimonas phyllosphaerae]
MTRIVRLARHVLAAAALGLVPAAGTAGAADLNLPVPTAVIYPGQSVLDRGVISARFTVPGNQLSAYVVEEGMLKDRIARRTLLPNQPILLSDLKSPDAVTVGQVATLIYREEGLLITGKGLPLQSAQAGQPVRVRNVDSGVLISGIASEDGSIEVSAQ